MFGAFAQNPDFKWIDRHKDSALFQEIQTSFSDELAPDRSQTGTIPMTIKFIHRIALRKNAALVLIAEKENEEIPYTAFRAFNFDLGTKRKSPLRTEDMAGFWMWRLEKVAGFTSADDTDIAFQFLSCTECEATHLLGAFHYSAAAGVWDLRQWSKEDGPWLMIGNDPQYGDDGAYLYDCLHVITDVTSHGLQDVAVRCRESFQPDLEKPSKRVTKDETLLYHASKNGQLTRTVIEKHSPHFATVQAALCATRPKSLLCRKFPASTKPSAGPR